MEKSDIQLLLKAGKFPHRCRTPEMIETHISYVILCQEHVYKIKKPIKYDFLDFSTLARRKHYCKQELDLNRRLSHEVYLDVLPIKNHNGTFSINGNEGKTVDYTVRMKKIKPSFRADLMLREGKLNKGHIRKIVETLVPFHETAAVIHGKDLTNIEEKFNALEKECPFLAQNLGRQYACQIIESISKSNRFIARHQGLLTQRSADGLVKDVHGDLHLRNIFLCQEPIIFDCIEFNDDFRQIDILNELAFFCMDLDAFGAFELSEYFMENYMQHSSMKYGDEDHNLFIYYKAYRANVRAKVNGLRARAESKSSKRKKHLEEVKKYLKLMNHYLDDLD